MISLVVCSVNSGYLASLQENVIRNIGVECEWLIWHNSETNLGISEVYNKMAAQSKFPYTCFLHEDVLINTPGWGLLLIDTLNKNNVALIGVAGGKYKSQLYSGWYSGGPDYDFYSLTHRTNGVDEMMIAPQHWQHPIEEVITIDGVFMFCQTDTWRSSPFDERSLKGFHYYDIDFSLRIAQHAKVIVTNQLKLIHFSKGGDFGDRWVRQTIEWHERNKLILPGSIVSPVEKNIDIVVARYWLDWLKNMDISFSNRWHWVRSQGLFRKMELWYSISKFFLYKPLGLKRLHHFVINKINK